MEHNWQLIKRDTRQKERLNRRTGMTTKEMRQSCQMMRIQDEDNDDETETGEALTW